MTGADRPDGPTAPDAALGLDQLLGLVLDEVGPDAVRGHLTVTAKLHQPYGIVHGGVYCAVVETAASLGGATWFTDGDVVGVSNHTDFYRAVRTGVLSVLALPVHRGRTQQVWQVEIRDVEQRLVSSGQVRLANTPGHGFRSPESSPRG